MARLEAWADSAGYPNPTVNRTEPVSDPYGVAWQHNHALDLPYPVRWGVVIDVLPHLGAHRVCTGPSSMVWCSLGSPTGQQPFGVRQCQHLPIGTPVYFVEPQGPGFWGHILCAEPHALIDNVKYKPDRVWPGSRAGLLAEACHKTTLDQPYGGGACNWSCGAPIDGTSLGEWSHFTELGTGLHLDPFLGYFRLDEESGLFLFTLDQQVRLAGHNLQLRSSAGERDELDDQGELTIEHGTTPYPWEALGSLMAQGVATPTRSYTQSEVQGDKQEYFYTEPAYDDQQPLYRCQAFGGYLGQGGKVLICIPPTTRPGDAQLNRYSQDLKIPGVYEANTSLTGSVMTRSATRIGLWKRPCIPTPKRRRLPSDTAGDTSLNYRPAGINYGGGDPHKIAGTASVPTSTIPDNLVRAAAVLDLAALAFNWEGSHPFVYHARDWYLPEEGDADLPVTKNHSLKDAYDRLKTHQYLNAPDPISVPIDHRYGSTRIYPNESYIQLLEDGGIVLGDGFGAEIRMAGGSIEISAPGDVVVRSGRNTINLAGRDAITRALNSVDLTATKRDVRLKAQANCMIEAGNNGCGGVLIESRATCPAYDYTGKSGEAVTTSGVVLKAANSQVVGLAKDVVFNSGYNGATGDIVLDAGTNRIKEVAAWSERFLSGGGLDFFGSAGSYTAANEFRGTGAIFGASLAVDGNLHVNGCGIFKDWLAVTSGHIATSNAEANGRYVGVLSSANISAANGELASLHTHVGTLTSTVGPGEKTALDSTVAVEGKGVEFSLRRPEDYKTPSDFALVESRWQQLDRLGADVLVTWQEVAVTTSDPSYPNSYPWPGVTALTGASTWYTQDLALYDVALGVSVSRSGHQAAYEVPVLQTPAASSLNSSYTVVDNS